MLNRTTLMGRITADPELRKTQKGTSVTGFTIAVERDMKSPNGEKQTDFFEVIAWAATAEFVCNYLKKGRMIVADGRLQTRGYTDKQGNKRKVVELVADNVYFADSKRDDDGQPGNTGYHAPGFPQGRAVDFDSHYRQDEFREIGDDEDGELPF